MTWLPWWFRKTVAISLALFGLLSLVLLGMIAVPLSRPPAMASVNRSSGADLSDLPAVSRFQARDGTELAFRQYRPQIEGIDRVAILVHGSSGGSRSMHTLAKAVAARGVETWAVDVRGHAASGTRGDIGYLGQLKDDLADLVGHIRTTRPNAEITLVGFSSGGGFALRIAGSPHPEPVRAHDPARALSRPRCAIEPAELRRLGERGCSAHPRPRRIAHDRPDLLRIAAGARFRRSAEFGEDADRHLFVSPDGQFRCVSATTAATWPPRHGR